MNLDKQMLRHTITYCGVHIHFIQKTVTNLLGTAKIFSICLFELDLDKLNVKFEKIKMMKRVNKKMDRRQKM